MLSIHSSGDLSSVPTTACKGTILHAKDKFNVDVQLIKSILTLNFPPTDVYEIKSVNDIPKDLEFKCDISSFPFIYEFERTRKASSSKMSTVSRWKKCSDIYVVFQGCQQIGLARHLEHNHYQESIGIVISNISSLFDSNS